MENKETAIDWLVERINYHKLNQNLTLERLYELKKIAKDLEKHQILKAHSSGQILENGSDYIGLNEEVNAEIYYDKTYGK